MNNPQDRADKLAEDIHAAIAELAGGANYPDLTAAVNKLAAQAARASQPKGEAVPLAQPRHDLARLVESIKSSTRQHGRGLSITEAIGALELAKLELLKEQQQ